jgi:uncharacterized protein YcbK (DUF882 family)
MLTMTPNDWALVRNFRPNGDADKFGDPMKMDRELIFTLDAFRDYVGRPILVHCGYEERPGNKGYHPLGMAVDIHIEGMHVIDQFIAASRISAFRGIGVYPFWNNPGLHLDTRQSPRGETARWARDAAGNYVALDWAFIRKLAR